MPNYKIIYTDPSTKAVVVLTPTPQWLAIKGNTVKKCAERDVPKGVSYRIIPEQDLPKDRLFRAAWTDEFDTPTVDVHLDRAKAIHLTNLRLNRNDKLNKLDKEYMLALEHGLQDRTKQIANKKQKLRDMPIQASQEMIKISSVEELEQYIPDILNEV